MSFFRTAADIAVYQALAAREALADDVRRRGGEVEGSFSGGGGTRIMRVFAGGLGDIASSPTRKGF